MNSVIWNSFHWNWVVFGALTFNVNCSTYFQGPRFSSDINLMARNFLDSSSVYARGNNTTEVTLFSVWKNLLFVLEKCKIWTNNLGGPIRISCNTRQKQGQVHFVMNVQMCITSREDKTKLPIKFIYNNPPSLIII